MLLTYFAIALAFSVVTGQKGECDGLPEIVTRKEWNAREPYRTSDMTLPLNQVIIIHTVTSFCDTKPKCIRLVQAMQNDHMDHRGFWDIAYQFLVGGDGRIYEGVGWSKVGAHTINYNTNSIGLAFIGNFMKVSPTKAALEAAQQLIRCGVKKGYLTPTVEVHGHRDVTCFESPGDVLYNIIRKWKNYKGGRMPGFIC